MPAHFIQANTNGRLHPATEPSIAPLNRGFLYGDAIYEVWRTYHEVIFAWDEHWARLERSAASLYMTLPWSREFMLAEIKKTAAAYRKFPVRRGRFTFVCRSRGAADPSGSTSRWRT